MNTTITFGQAIIPFVITVSVIVAYALGKTVGRSEERARAARVRTNIAKARKAT